MLKIAFAKSFAHPLPEGHRFPMVKYELIPEQLLHEGLITEENLFYPDQVDEEIILWTHDKDYWQQLRDLTLPVERNKAYRLSIIGTINRTQYAYFARHHYRLPLCF